MKIVQIVKVVEFKGWGSKETVIGTSKSESQMEYLVGRLNEKCGEETEDGSVNYKVNVIDTEKINDELGELEQRELFDTPIVF